MEKPIFYKTAHCKFWIFLMKITKKLETQFQPGIEKKRGRPPSSVVVRLQRRLQIPGYIFLLLLLSDMFCQYQIIIAYHCTRFRQNPFFRIHLIYRHSVVAFCCHFYMVKPFRILVRDLTKPKKK